MLKDAGYMKNLKTYWLYVAGAFVGSFSGFLYYKLVGSTSIVYSIASGQPYSIFYFTIMGALLFGLFSRPKLTKQEEFNNSDAGEDV